MKKELQDKLFNDFPLLYVDKSEPITKSLVPFGFDCLSGWYNILYELSAKLEKMIQEWIAEHGLENHPRAFQIKQKFGGLCFYLGRSSTKEMYEAIGEASAQARKTCEHCGKPGSLDSDGHWLITLCDECKQIRKEQKELYYKWE